MTELISLKARQRKSLSPLANSFGTLGFTTVSCVKDGITLERVFGYDLQGKPELDYRIVFSRSEISLEYSVPKGKTKNGRLLAILPVFTGCLQLTEDYYDMKPSALYEKINVALDEAMKAVDKDSVELATELSELKSSHRSLSAKYDALLKSSEENARILVECERKRDELSRKVEQLMRYSDSALKEMVYEWIRLHGGKINLLEFSKIHRIPIQRAEEGINMLMKEGYLKRRFE